MDRPQLSWDTVRSYSEVMLDLECVVNQIQRGKHLVAPRGDTVVEPGDVLVVLSTRGDDEHLSRLLCEGALR